MTNKRIPNKRTNYFINKDFQARFIVKFCLLVVFSGLLTMGILYFLGKESTTVAIINSEVVVRSTADFLLPILVQTILIVMVIVGLATIAVTLLFSHKIAGPLYHFKKVMKRLSDGDFSKDVHIRSYDQLQDLANDFNSMIKIVREQIKLAKDNVAKLKDKKGNISDKDIEELDKNIKFFKT
jgi:methyl-accepting chemotaxis protein